MRRDLDWKCNLICVRSEVRRFFLFCLAGAVLCSAMRFKL